VDVNQHANMHAAGEDTALGRVVWFVMFVACNITVASRWFLYCLLCIILFVLRKC